MGEGVDVCVVGAGYAGLTAARRLAQAGRSVVVLEARDRVGGRVWSQEVGGAVVDLGGTFVAPYHDRLLALADEMGVGTYRTYDTGDALLARGRRHHRYPSTKTPRLNPLALASAGQAIARLERMAKAVPVDAPWTAAKAGRWDAVSIAAWLTPRNVPTQEARDLIEATFHALFCADLSEVSLLDALFLCRAHGGLVKLMSVEGGAQDQQFDGGAQAAALRVADELGDAVWLSSPVVAVVQRGDRVDVHTEGETVTASHVVLTIPPSLTGRIRFDPALPADHALLRHSAPAGTEIKALVVYPTPFWRDEGLAGASVALDDRWEVSLDSSPASGAPGVLALFAAGPKARSLALLPAEERRAEALATLTRRFGTQAAEPAGYQEQNWAEEEWTRGCSMAHFGTGVLTQFGHLLTEPVGRIHWAGTETATVSHGAIDGAVRSGERVAQELLA